MSTLLLRLAAPLQSWGVDSKFEERRATMREPTKSGVIGLLAAALGRRREEPIDDLSRLRFGVRIDQPGKLLRDYHTVKSPDGNKSYVTNRYYLSDAVFLVGFEGDHGILHILHEALLSPVFPLYLGRRSCPPVGKITLGISEKVLEDALYTECWQASKYIKERSFRSDKPHNLTIVNEAVRIGNIRRPDLPLSFSQRHRRYDYRYIVDKPEAVSIHNLFETEHDAFGSVEEGI